MRTSDMTALVMVQHLGAKCFDAVTTSAVAKALVLLILGLGILAAARHSRQTQKSTQNRHAAFWASLPTAGVSTTSFFPWTMGALRSIAGSAKNAADGYERFCKKRGIPFALPNLAVGAIVALPPSQLHVLNMSEKHIVAAEAQSEAIQPRYMIGNHELYENNIHFDIVRKHLARGAGFLARDMAEEIDAAFRDSWGVDSQNWTTVDAWDSLSKVIARAAHRALMGLPLCRDEHLLEQSRRYANAMFLGAAIITTLPEWTRPVLGPLCALPARRHLARCNRVLVPLVDERLRRWDGGKGADEMPDDALQWMMERCAKAGPGQMEAKAIVQRLLILTLVSIYTTSFAFTNCVLDVYANEDRDDFVAGLRHECEAAGELTSGQAVDGLIRVDSALRESMRLSCFGIVSLPRTVAPGAEIDLGGGIRAPAGVRLGVPSQAIHRDANHYPQPLRFDAFCFSRDFEGPDGVKRQAAAQQRSVDVSETFLTYGFGKHSCPGRYFASQLMKQAMAHVVQHYDVECEGKLPRKTALLNMMMPPVGARIRVRRRSGG